MRIHTVRARNFMSLRVFEMKEIDPKLNFVVGPNGSGKSSVLRAIRTLIEGARAVGLSTPFEDGRLLYSRGAPTEEFEVALDLEFDTEWEQDLIATYVCAALTNPENIRQALSSKEPGIIASNEGAAQYAFWLQELLRPEIMPFLFHGELRFSYRYFVRDTLQLTYTFTINDTPVIISMGSLFGYYGVFSIGNPPTTLSATSPASDVLLDYWTTIGEFAEIREVMRGNRLTAQVLPGSFDFAMFVKRLAEARAVIEVRILPSTYSPYPGPHKRLQELLSRQFDANQSAVTLAELFHVLLMHDIVMTSNFRYPPERTYTYSPQEPTLVASGIYNDRQLAQRLFDLKNGDSAARETYRSAQETFTQITGDGLMFDVISAVNEGAVTLQIRTIENGGEIPITYHGAGIWEALVLSVLLMDNIGKVTLLDEPAANLHPQMQRRFLSIIERVHEKLGGGQLIIITHSQHLLPTQAKDLPKICRLQRVDSSTVAFGLGSKSKVPPDKLEREMGNSSDLAGLLFANGVILVEGATEVGAISVWFPQLETSHGQSLADDNVALYSVNGKPNFPFHVQYLTEFGVPWVAICDGDALDASQPNSIWETVGDLGKPTEAPSASNFAVYKLAAERCGFFTANTLFTERHGFEDIPEIKMFLAEHTSGASRSKSRQGRYIAHNLTCPEDVAHTIQAASEWLRTSAPEGIRRYVRSLEPRV